MTRLALTFLLATLVTGCGVHVRAGVPGPVPPTPPRVTARRAPTPAPARPSTTHTLRAKDLEASFVHARVIYAEEVVASTGRVGRIEYWGDGHRGQGRGHSKGRGQGHAKHGDGPDFRWGSRDVSMPEVHADVIYVKELRARHVEAQVIVARNVRIGR